MFLMGIMSSQASAGSPTAYPLNDDGTVAAQFGVGWLETDAPAYTSADYTYTGAATGGKVVATPAQANIFASQAVTVTSADILSLEAEIISNDSVAFDDLAIGCLMLPIDSNTPFEFPYAYAADSDGSTPTWGGNGISAQTRASGIAGFRVGIDFIGSTGQIRIKSTDGIEISSTTFTPPIRVVATIQVADAGISDPGDTTSLRLVVPASGYQIPCPEGAKNLLGEAIFSPTNLPGTLDLWKWNDLTRLWTTSKLSTPVASVGDPVGAWRGQMDNFTLATSTRSRRFELQADGVLANAASTYKALTCNYSRNYNSPFSILMRIKNVTGGSPRFYSGTTVTAGTVIAGQTVASGGGKQQSCVNNAYSSTASSFAGDDIVFVLSFDGTNGFLLGNGLNRTNFSSGAAMVNANNIVLEALTGTATSAKFCQLQLVAGAVSEDDARRWITWARNQSAAVLPPSPPAFNPLSIPNTIDLWKYNDLSRLWTTNALTTNVSAVSDPVGAWRGQLDALTLETVTTSYRPEYAADGILFDSSSTPRELRKAYSLTHSQPFSLLIRMKFVSTNNPWVGGFRASGGDGSPMIGLVQKDVNKQRGGNYGYYTTCANDFDGSDVVFVYSDDGSTGFVIGNDLVKLPLVSGPWTYALTKIGVYFTNGSAAGSAKICQMQFIAGAVSEADARDWITWARSQP